MKRGKYVLGVVLILVVATTAGVAAVVARAPSAAEASHSTEDVLPAVIPPQGVTLLRGSADVTLMPASSVAASASITPEQALSIAPKPGSAVGNPMTLLAVVTIGASLPSPGESAGNSIQDRLVWVVVYTVPPHDVRMGGRFIQNSFPVIRSHVVSLIDAQTGEDLGGILHQVVRRSVDTPAGFHNARNSEVRERPPDPRPSGGAIGQQER